MTPLLVALGVLALVGLIVVAARALDPNARGAARSGGRGAAAESAGRDNRVVGCPNCGRRAAIETILCATCGSALAGGTSGEGFDAPSWAFVSFASLNASGARVLQVPYLAVGGGVGSFIWVDHLRVSGVPEKLIRVIGPHGKPYRRFQWLCANGQIDLNDPLRSSSDARPDNLWGFPGYALQAAWRSAKRFRFGAAGHYLWQVATEPDLANTFVPRARQVFANVDREARRIGWEEMRIPGTAHWLRKTDDGRFVVAVEDALPGGPLFVVARFVQVALGYGGIRLLPDIARMRVNGSTAHGTEFGANGHGRNGGVSSHENGGAHGDAHGDAHGGAHGERRAHADDAWLVQAYEPHGRLYDELVRSGGTVLIRGRGVTASRVLERVGEIRDRNSDIRVVHLLRSHRPGYVRWRRARRWIRADRDLQTFNWPKAAWGGEVRRILSDMPEAERARAYAVLGGTTTPPAASYVRTVDRGLEDGWYRLLYGELAGVEADDGAVTCDVETDVGTMRLPVTAVVDATGLDGDPGRHPFLADAAEQYGLTSNLSGGLDVDPRTFEVPGLRNRGGRVYLAGVAAAGGSFAPVDSFLGLQVAAQSSIDAMRTVGAPRLRGLSPARSIRGWLRWVRGRAP